METAYFGIRYIDDENQTVSTEIQEFYIVLKTYSLAMVGSCFTTLPTTESETFPLQVILWC